jgi:hypothetical protein
MRVDRAVEREIALQVSPRAASLDVRLHRLAGLAHGRDLRVGHPAARALGDTAFEGDPHVAQFVEHVERHRRHDERAVRAIDQRALGAQVGDEKKLEAEIKTELEAKIAELTQEAKAKIAEAKQRVEDCSKEHAQIDDRVQSIKELFVAKCRAAPLVEWSAEDVALWVRTEEGGRFQEHAPEFAKRSVAGRMLANMKREETFNFLVYSNLEHQAALWARLLELRRHCDPRAWKKRKKAGASSSSSSATTSSSSSSASGGTSSAVQVKIEGGAQDL